MLNGTMLGGLECGVGLADVHVTFLEVVNAAAIIGLVDFVVDWILESNELPCDIPVD